jgi:hypothetical protein
VQQAKASASRVEAEADRPGEGYFNAAPRLAIPPISQLPLSVLAEF